MGHVYKIFRLKINVRYAICLLSITCFIYILCFNKVLSKKKDQRKWYEIPTSDMAETPAVRYLVDTKGCRISYMDAYDKSIRQCLYYEDPIECDKEGQGMLVNYIGNTLYVNMTLLPKYGLTEETLDCCYQAFTMIPLTDEDLRNVTFKVPNMRYGECIRFTTAEIKNEFVKVQCRLPNNATYEDVFVFVHEEKYNSPRENDKLSVLVIGFDSVSRLNFHRQMPKTVKFLKEQNVVEMFGYNEVGSNTYPNMVPALTGMTVEELEKLCTPMEYKTFDDCPLIWKKYKSEGFTTGYGEDLGWFGLLTGETKFRRHEFKKPSTDFFLNQLSIAARNIRHEKRGNYHLCIGKRIAFEILVDAIKQFAINLKNLQTFGFFFTYSVTHDTLNLLRYGDDYFYNMLSNLSAHGVFNKTILILMSDHGSRYGAIRRTYQGYLEEKLPLQFFMYPPWFSSKYPKAVENLKANSHRLVSAFDFYKTLIDLIDLKNISNSALDNRFYDKSSTIGTSLFLPINESRTCDDAGIPKFYCTCDLTGSVPISINDSNVKESTEHVIVYLNRLLKDYKQCSKLYFNRIIDARLVRKPTFRSQKASIEDYTVILETKPSMAHFEAIVRHNDVRKSFDVLPPVSRINEYGNQSYCIDSTFLKLYCYCKILKKELI